MKCRHCHKANSSRPRGLCWACYYTPRIRDHYPSTSKFARRGVGNFNSDAPLADYPTEAIPGSEAKIRILIERAHSMKSLFHPLDSIVIAPDEVSEPLYQDSAVNNWEFAELREAG
jgi:hypothetical protein